MERLAFGLDPLSGRWSGSFPAWVKSPAYWGITVAMVLAGGGLVVIYMKSELALNAWLAVNIGASAPLIIGAMTEQAPKLPMGRID